MPTSAQSPRTVERFVIGQARAVVRHVIVPGETGTRLWDEIEENWDDIEQDWDEI